MDLNKYLRRRRAVGKDTAGRRGADFRRMTVRSADRNILSSRTAILVLHRLQQTGSGLVLIKSNDAHNHSA